MKKLPALLSLLALTCPLSAATAFAEVPLSASVARPAAPAQLHESKASPFDGLRWKGDQPEVDVEGVWYTPVKIAGVDVQAILGFCDKRWRGERQKRFGEDLVEAMVLMGHKPGARVALELVRLSDGEAITLKEVEMTRAKRSAIRDAGSRRSRRPAAPRSPKSVSRELAIQDIRAFGDGLQAQFAYLERKGLDLDAQLEALKPELEDDADVQQLAGALNRILMTYGDGHARVSAAARREPAQHLPFLMASAGGGVVAFQADRSALLDPKRPFVQALDGQSVEDWIDAVRVLVPAGSDSLVRGRALGLMREFQYVQEELGLAVGTGVKVTLSSKPKGGRKQDVELRLERRRPTFGSWPRPDEFVRIIKGKGARGLKNGVGVIRLARMEDELIPDLRDAMDQVRETDGLIIDVRGNGGGLRGLLAALSGYLLDDETGPVVANCAAYRLAPEFREDHLGGARLLYRADDERWSKRQRAAIAAFAESFQPEWKLPAGFSEWHYLVLDATGHPREYRYAAPVVVLIDEGCFSATDIFAAGMGAIPGVTLLGTTTSGGSARVQSFELPATKITVRCASMASFQPDGRLYDGNGVEPDVEVPREPSNLINGGGDAQLRAAIEHLRKAR